MVREKKGLLQRLSFQCPAFWDVITTTVMLRQSCDLLEICFASTVGDL